jgi:hypothetical protein
MNSIFTSISTINKGLCHKAYKFQHFIKELISVLGLKFSNITILIPFMYHSLNTLKHCILHRFLALLQKVTLCSSFGIYNYETNDSKLCSLDLWGQMHIFCGYIFINVNWIMNVNAKCTSLLTFVYSINTFLVAYGIVEFPIENDSNTTRWFFVTLIK